MARPYPGPGRATDRISVLSRLVEPRAGRDTSRYFPAALSVGSPVATGRVGRIVTPGLDGVESGSAYWKAQPAVSGGRSGVGPWGRVHSVFPRRNAGQGSDGAATLGSGGGSGGLPAVAATRRPGARGRGARGSRGRCGVGRRVECRGRRGQRGRRAVSVRGGAVRSAARGTDAAGCRGGGRGEPGGDRGGRGGPGWTGPPCGGNGTVSGGGPIRPERCPVADVPLLSDGGTDKGLRRTA